MFFHFVKKGDSIYNLSKHYSVEIDQISENNSLINPGELVINQCLLINKNTYKVKRGDNLYEISKKFNISLNEIKKFNPQITSDFIKENQIINLINKDKNKKVFNGYAYEFSSLENIKKTLPYLTYLSIFSYRVDEEGNLSEVNDDQMIRMAKEYNVKPIMVITNSKQKGGFSPDIVNKIVTNENIIDTLFANIERVLKDKDYYGLNIDFEYVNPNDKDNFIRFIKKASQYFKQRNYYLSIALAPKYNDEQKGLLYEAHDYKQLSNFVDNVIIMTYEWGYTYGPSMAVAPINEVKKVLNYATTRIDREKIIMGIPNYGYDFKVPYEKGQKAKSITNPQAIVIAYNNHSEIKRNQKYMTPYFNYLVDNQEHEVHFDDPCSIEEKLSLIDEYNIGGGSIWTISNYCEYIYLLINNGYIVQK